MVTEKRHKTSWEKAGNRRRLLLLILILLPSALAAHVMYSLLPVRGWPGLNLIITALFAVLFAWISVGFWSSAVGVVLLLRRYDRFSVTRGTDDHSPLPGDFRTAILFPVYNEDCLKVSEGVRSVLESLKREGLENHFDVFILSDSTNPDIWVAEEEAWHRLCCEQEAFGRLFYRHRKSNLKRKSGNIADFCRRWGANYRYMVVFDADSLMTGPTLGRMVKTMEAHREIGILQTAPKVIFSRSLLARAQQFANHLYGPIFAAGLHYWQLGDAQYWGHNAIIRVQPFMDHCQLPKLPGRAPLGGEILSHDFVESALMRRAGYSVWLAYDLGGSYEQSPPNLMDELVRDRRWCQGNLQHSRLIFTRGFFPTHRALFVNGIMSYGSALLWFFFLAASSAEALSVLFIRPEYFPEGPSLFHHWPTYFPLWALTLLSGTAGLLFLPKLFAVVLVAFKGGSRSFGGFGPMVFSVGAEVVISTFLAPVRMLFHSLFVVTTLLGAKVGWNAQNRDDSGTAWGEALGFHWWGTLVGLGWGGLMYLVSPGFFLWLSPVVAGLALSIPLSVWTSRVSLGALAARLGLFLTPVEVRPPKEIELYGQNLARPRPASDFKLAWDQGFARAVTIGRVYALHCSLLGQSRPIIAARAERLSALAARALAEGPQSLSSKEKTALLNDRRSLAFLHREVWRLDSSRAAGWGLN